MAFDPITLDTYSKLSMDKGRVRDFNVDQVLTIDIKMFEFRMLDTLAGEEQTTTKEIAEILLEEAINEKYQKFQEARQRAVEAATSTLLGALSPELAAKVAQELGLKSVPVEASNSRSSGKVPDLAAQLQAKKAKGGKPNKEVEAVQEPKS